MSEYFGFFWIYEMYYLKQARKLQHIRRQIFQIQADMQRLTRGVGARSADGYMGGLCLLFSLTPPRLGETNGNCLLSARRRRQQ